MLFRSLMQLYLTLDNELSLKKRKEVEKYLINNPDAQELVEGIKITIAQLKKIPKLKANKDFNKKLLNKIDRYDSNSIKKREGNSIYICKIEASSSFVITRPSSIKFGILSKFKYL